MTMKIKLTDDARVEAALDAVNGKATSFTIQYASVVRGIAEDAEKALALLPKAQRSGAVVTFTPSGPSAGAYKNSAISTIVTLQRGSSAWFLIGVGRTSVYPKQTERLSITITKGQADVIIKAAIRPFTIQAVAAEFLE